MRRILFWTLWVLICGWPSGAWSGVTLDVETGYVFASLNDTRIPNATGSLLSLTRDLDSKPAPFTRFQATMRLGERHDLRFLYAPLRLISVGRTPREILFDGGRFPADT